VVLAVVVALHLALIWLLINNSTRYRATREISTTVRLIAPEMRSPKIGATLKSPVIVRSVVIVPKIAPPQVVVMAVKPAPTAPPAPAPAAVSGSSASSLGNKTLPPDDFTAYLQLVHNRLQMALNAIMSNRFSQIPGIVLVALDIDRSGKIVAWQIMDADHPKTLDGEIQLLMQDSDPLPPFPATIRADHLVTATRVVFREPAEPGFGPEP